MQEQWSAAVAKLPGWGLSENDKKQPIPMVYDHLPANTTIIGVLSSNDFL